MNIEEVDINFTALEKMEAAGRFKALETGTYVSLVEGELIGVGSSYQELVDQLSDGQGNALIHQIGVPFEVARELGGGRPGRLRNIS